MLPTNFKTFINSRIETGLVCLGEFDGEKTSLALGTSGNRVLIQSSDNNDKDRGGSEGGGDEPRHKFLNMNRQISALACGKIDQEKHPKRDILLVGSPSSLLAYDVYDNSDKFFVDVPEGVHSVAFGKLHRSEKPLTFVGGNCSLQGFDHEGNEGYWTVIGGNASALTFCDADRDGSKELLVGSDDFEIRAFQNEESIFEVTETESVTKLCTMGDKLSCSRFGYGLKNGTIGVYDGKTRVWRVKAKDNVTSMISFDLDGDGVDELITGWTNGKLEARRDEDGQVVYREILAGSVSGLLKGDYRNSKSGDQLICCTLDGEIRGYSSATSTEDSLFVLGAASGGIESNKTFGDADPLGIHGEANNGDQVMQALKSGGPSMGQGDSRINNNSNNNDGNIVEKSTPDNLATQQNKRSLEFRDSNLVQLQEEMTLKLMELQSLEASLADQKSGKQSIPEGSIPSGTKVTLSLTPNKEKGCLDLEARVNNDECVIQSILVFALDSGVFEKECQTASAKGGRSGPKLVASLYAKKNLAAELKVQTFVSARGSSDKLHVFKDCVALSKFAMFVSQDLNPHELGDDVGSATFGISISSFEPVAKCIGKLFGIDERVAASTFLKDNGNRILASFVKLGEKSLRICIQGHIENSSNMIMCIRSDVMDTAAQIIQEMGKHLSISELETSVDFPVEMRRLEALMEQVSDLKDIRQRLGAEMADESHYIKSLVVKAEDSRILCDVTNIGQTYQELTTLNGQLIGEYKKRENNQAQLLESLREVNSIIQQASRLRIGKPQSAVIAACRKAIKGNNLPALFHALTSASL